MACWDRLWGVVNVGVECWDLLSCSRSTSPSRSRVLRTQYPRSPHIHIPPPPSTPTPAHSTHFHIHSPHPQLLRGVWSVDVGAWTVDVCVVCVGGVEWSGEEGGGDSGVIVVCVGVLDISTSNAATYTHPPSPLHLPHPTPMQHLTPHDCVSSPSAFCSQMCSKTDHHSS